MKEKSLQCVSMPIQTRQNFQRQSGGGEVILKKISETRRRTNPNPHLCFLMRNSSHAISLLTPVLPGPPRPVFISYNFWDTVMEVKSKLEILSQHSRCCFPFSKQEADIATFIYKCRKSTVQDPFVRKENNGREPSWQNEDLGSTASFSLKGHISPLPCNFLNCSVKMWLLSFQASWRCCPNTRSIKCFGRFGGIKKLSWSEVVMESHQHCSRWWRVLEGSSDLRATPAFEPLSRLLFICVCSAECWQTVFQIMLLLESKLRTLRINISSLLSCMAVLMGPLRKFLPAILGGGGRGEGSRKDGTNCCTFLKDGIEINHKEC